MAESKPPETGKTPSSELGEALADVLSGDKAEPAGDKARPTAGKAKAKATAGKGKAKPADGKARPSRRRRFIKSVLGVLPLFLMAWLLSAMAAAAAAPRWLAIAVASVVVIGPPGWHFWAERRRKKAGKPEGGSFTRHDRWLLRAVAALGIPLLVIAVFFRGAAWDAIKSDGLWFAKSPPKTEQEVSVDRLRYLPKDARAVVDLSLVEDQARSFLVLLFQGKLRLLGDRAPTTWATGAQSEHSVFVFPWRDVKAHIAEWKKEQRRGRDVWLDPDGDHIAVRAGGTLLLVRDEWLDAVVDAIENIDASAISGELRKATELMKPDARSVLSFVAQKVRLNADLELELGYLVWSKTATGIELRGGVGGSAENRKAAEKALIDRFEAKRKEFPVVEKLELKTKTSGELFKFSLDIPAETLQAILLQPAIFAP